jgi:hypothetical protein
MDAVRRSSAVASSLVLALLACAPARPPPPLPARPVERSSVDVLLRHRGELSLTEAQVSRLEALDAQLESDLATLRARLADRKRAKAEASDRPADIGTGSGRPPPGSSAGSGNRAMASTAGPASRGGSGPVLGPRKEDELTRLRQRMDDADTRAYVTAATEVLSEAQRPTAERLASTYREALYDYQEALRLRGGLPPGE